jgi:hypothetical protein
VPLAFYGYRKEKIMHKDKCGGTGTNMFETKPASIKKNEFFGKWLSITDVEKHV